MLAVQVLVQTVVVPCSVLQQQRCRTSLAGVMAALQEGRMCLGKAAGQAHARLPAIGQRYQSRIQGAAQWLHRLGQRVVEVLILATAETVPGHHHPGAKQPGLVVHRPQVLAFPGTQQAGDDGTAVLIEAVLQ
ncbi:hypothetical protein D3C76_1558650 [compost metagenome]